MAARMSISSSIDVPPCGIRHHDANTPSGSTRSAIAALLSQDLWRPSALGASYMSVLEELYRSAFAPGPSNHLGEHASASQAPLSAFIRRICHQK